MNLNPWLSRLSYSMLILAAGLGWTAYRRGTGGEWSLPVVCVVSVVAGVCFVLFLMGVKARHRPDSASHE
jgi:hypothetical protein